MWVGRGYVRRLVRRIAQLESELQLERKRSRRREDELVDRVLTATGRHGLTPEPRPKQERSIPNQPVNAIDEARLMALREAAVRAGRPASDGDAVWKAQRNGHTPAITLPDEPYIPPQ